MAAGPHLRRRTGLSMNKWMFVGYALAAGILMSIFVLTTGVFRYVFSLGAILVGMQFFKREEEKKPRIWFVVLVFLFAMFLPVIAVSVSYANGWYVPDYLRE
jgi:RsiW-degrading membrane proteinase PrsW (M82 family)